MILILPEIKNIQVINLKSSDGKIVTEEYNDKNSGNLIKSYVPIITPFGAPFTRIKTQEFSLNRNPAKEIMLDLEYCIRLAFFMEKPEFKSSEEISIGILCGARTDYTPEFPGDVVKYYVRARTHEPPGLNRGSILEQKLYTMPAQFYKILGKEKELE